MAQWVGLPAAKPGDLSSSPKSHTYGRRKESDFCKLSSDLRVCAVAYAHIEITEKPALCRNAHQPHRF